MVLYGKRRAGKTHLLKTIAYQMRPYYPYVICFTRTAFNGDLAQYFPKSKIVTEFQPGLIKKVLAVQKMRVTKARRMAKITGVYPNARLLIICDDVLSSEQGFRYNHDMIQLFMEGRHFLTSAICTSQDSKGLPPDLKSQTDISFFFEMQATRDFKAIGEGWMPFLKNEDDFVEFIRKVLRYKLQFISLVNIRATKKMETQVFTGISTPEQELPRFVMGSHLCWDTQEDAEQLIEMDFEDLLSHPSLTQWGIEEVIVENRKVKEKAAKKRVNAMKRHLGKTPVLDFNKEQLQ